MKRRLEHMKQCKKLVLGKHCRTCNSMLFLFKFLQSQQSRESELIERGEEETLGKSLSIILEEESIDHEEKKDDKMSNRPFISMGEALQENLAGEKVLLEDTIQQINATVLNLDAELKKIDRM